MFNQFILVGKIKDIDIDLSSINVCTNEKININLDINVYGFGSLLNDLQKGDIIFIQGNIMSIEGKLILFANKVIPYQQITGESTDVTHL